MSLLWPQRPKALALFSLRTLMAQAIQSSMPKPHQRQTLRALAST